MVTQVVDLEETIEQSAAITLVLDLEVVKQDSTVADLEGIKEDSAAEFARETAGRVRSAEREYKLRRLELQPQNR